MIKTILVVDDEQGYRDLICMELSGQGDTVLTACDGLEAMEIMTREKVNLVITDMKMPKLDGLGTVKAIKRSYPGTPIILMTGYAMEDEVKEALSLKASFCLRKPFDISELNSVVKTVAP